MKNTVSRKLKFNHIPPSPYLDEIESHLADCLGTLHIENIHTHATLLGKEAVCRSEVYYLGDGIWRLDSMYTILKHQNKGHGTKHFANVLSWLKRRRREPCRALVFEIANRSQSKLSSSEAEERAERGRFYERFKAQTWDKILLVPVGRGEDGQLMKSTPLKQMELLAITFDGKLPSQSDFVRAAQEVMCNLNGLSEDDALVRNVLSGNFPKGYPGRYSAVEQTA